MSNWFSFESDNDELDIDVRDSVTILDETAVDEAGEDSETVDVVPTEEETSHNEVASAGGISTGSNQDQLEMDPVAATEAYIYRHFGLSREEMDEAVDQVIAESEEIAASEPEETGDPDLDETAVSDSGGEVVDADDLPTADLTVDSDGLISGGDECEGDDCDDDIEDTAVEDDDDSDEESSEDMDNDEGDDDEGDGEESSESWYNLRW